MLSALSARSDPYIRAAVLCGFQELVTASRGDPVDLVKRAGIPQDALFDMDMLISWRALGVLMELASTELEKPSLGLEWALTVPAPFLNVGPLGLLARFTETLGEWFNLSRQYWRYHTNAYSLRTLEEEPGGNLILRFEMDKLVLPSRQQMEYTLGSTCEMSRVVAGVDDESYKRIRFQHLEPADTRSHERVFRCPVEYGCCHNEIVYDRKLMVHPMDGQLKPLSQMFDQYIAARIATRLHHNRSVRDTVEIAIPSLMGTGCCTIRHVARLLAVSPKKLQRLLAQEGTNFAELLDRERERMARRLLAESNAPMSSIAGLLGYSTTPPFTFAFRRWAGMPPREYRNAARKEGQPGCGKTAVTEK